MDPLTREIYEMRLKAAFRERGEGEFEDLFASIMERCHPGDFQRSTPWGRSGDRKNDGYLRSERRLFQCYAPARMTESAAIKKIDADFAAGLRWWKPHVDAWVFVHNDDRGLGPGVQKKLLDLGDAHAPVTVTAWGLPELRERVFRLSEPDLVSLFGAAPTFKDLRAVGAAEVRPLLEQIGRLPAGDADVRPVPAEKLERNMLSPSVEALLVAGMRKSEVVRAYFRRHHDPRYRDEVAEAFRVKYAELRDRRLAPDDVFGLLQAYVTGDGYVAPQDQAASLAILAFFFEECDIFERPESAP